jgi:exodeoxyribonuclease V alpha subunit
MNEMLDILGQIPNVSVLFLGDIRQLPSIGPGDFLNNIIQSGLIVSTELTQVVRNSGVITEVLDKITEGTMLVPSDYTNTPGFQWIVPTNKNYLSYITQCIKTPDDMIISATNRAINELTDEIRKIKNPNENQLTSFKYVDKDFNKITLKVGDPVILGQNFNADGLFNGMTGKITEISNSYNVIKMMNITKIQVQFDDGYFTFDSDSEYIKHLKPAYMITVHKSQGQEYPNIIVVLSESQLLNRNTLYTAISRAKNSVCLIVTEKVLAKAIKRKNKRNTLLVSMLGYWSNQENQIVQFNEFYLKEK